MSWDILERRGAAHHLSRACLGPCRQADRRFRSLQRGRRSEEHVEVFVPQIMNEQIAEVVTDIPHESVHPRAVEQNVDVSMPQNAEERVEREQQRTAAHVVECSVPQIVK